LDDCDAKVLLNIFLYHVFVGNGYLVLVPSYLPHLRELCLLGCINVCVKYVEELVAVAPEELVAVAPKLKVYQVIWWYCGINEE